MRHASLRKLEIYSLSFLLRHLNVPIIKQGMDCMTKNLYESFWVQDWIQKEKSPNKCGLRFRLSSGKDWSFFLVWDCLEGAETSNPRGSGTKLESFVRHDKWPEFVRR